MALRQRVRYRKGLGGSCFRQQSHFTCYVPRRMLVSAGTLRVLVEAAEIELQSDKCRSARRVAPIVGAKRVHS